MLNNWLLLLLYNIFLMQFSVSISRKKMNRMARCGLKVASLGNLLAVVLVLVLQVQVSHTHHSHYAGPECEICLKFSQGDDLFIASEIFHPLSISLQNGSRAGLTIHSVQTIKPNSRAPPFL